MDWCKAHKPDGTEGTATLEMKYDEGKKEITMRSHGCIVKNDANLKNFIQNKHKPGADLTKFEKAKYYFYTCDSEFAEKTSIIETTIHCHRFSKPSEDKTTKLEYSLHHVVKVQEHIFLPCNCGDYFNESQFLKEYSKELWVPESLDDDVFNNKEINGLIVKEGKPKFIPVTLKDCQSSNMFEVDKGHYEQLEDTGPVLLQNKKTIVGSYIKLTDENRITFSVFGHVQEEDGQRKKSEKPEGCKDEQKDPQVQDSLQEPTPGPSGIGVEDLTVRSDKGEPVRAQEVIVDGKEDGMVETKLKREEKMPAEKAASPWIHVKKNTEQEHDESDNPWVLKNINPLPNNGKSVKIKQHKPEIQDKLPSPSDYCHPSVSSSSHQGFVQQGHQQDYNHTRGKDSPKHPVEKDHNSREILAPYPQQVSNSGPEASHDPLEQIKRSLPDGSGIPDSAAKDRTKELQKQVKDQDNRLKSTPESSDRPIRKKGRETKTPSPITSNTSPDNSDVSSTNPSFSRYKTQTRDGRLENCRLENHTLRNCTLENCTLENCTLENCTLENCTLENCTLRNCTDENCTLENCTLENSADCRVPMLSPVPPHNPGQIPSLHCLTCHQRTIDTSVDDSDEAL